MISRWLMSTHYSAKVRMPNPPALLHCFSGADRPAQRRPLPKREGGVPQRVGALGRGIVPWRVVSDTRGYCGLGINYDEIWNLKTVNE